MPALLQMSECPELYSYPDMRKMNRIFRRRFGLRQKSIAYPFHRITCANLAEIAAQLAARLLGWKVDIFTESRYNEASAAGHSLEQVAGVAEIPVASLQEAGYTDLDKLRQASDEELVAALSLTESQLEHLRQALNFLNPGEDGGAKPDATADVSREEAHDEGQAE